MGFYQSPRVFLDWASLSLFLVSDVAYLKNIAWVKATFLATDLVIAVIILDPYRISRGRWLDNLSLTI
jgi:hypothetical protein